MGKIRDLSGNTYGKLTVIELNNDRSDSRRKYWDCVCSCGNTKVISSDSLLSGNSNSCGCYRKKATKVRAITHGKSKSPEYSAYHEMKKRCYNPNHKSYSNYGGRGIIICDLWLLSFNTFLKDMGEKPSNSYSIERVDVNGNYTPDNCIWADDFTQAANRRTHKNNTSGRCGVSFIKRLNKWQVNITFNKKNIYLGVYESFNEAFKVRESAELECFGFIKNK